LDSRKFVLQQTGIAFQLTKSAWVARRGPRLNISISGANAAAGRYIKRKGVFTSSGWQEQSQGGGALSFWNMDLVADRNEERAMLLARVGSDGRSGVLQFADSRFEVVLVE